MTSKQYKRWMKLSLALARGAYPNMTEQRRTKLLEAIQECIEYVYSCGGGLNDWDDGVGSIVDEFTCDCGYMHKHRGKFGSAMVACVRAGFDVAVWPSAGVLCFTVGDLRRGFDGDLPDWIANWFKPPLSANAPDHAGVWL